MLAILRLCPSKKLEGRRNINHALTPNIRMDLEAYPTHIFLKLSFLQCWHSYCLTKLPKWWAIYGHKEKHSATCYCRMPSLSGTCRTISKDFMVSCRLSQLTDHCHSKALLIIFEETLHKPTHNPNKSSWNRFVEAMSLDLHLHSTKPRIELLLPISKMESCMPALPPQGLYVCMYVFN